jgi:phage/plasmid primase-like uncharacterized protein
VKLAPSIRIESEEQSVPAVTNSAPATPHVSPVDRYSISDAVGGFQSAMRAAGLPAAEVVADGQLRRFHVEGDRRAEKNGWYVLFADAMPAGVFGCWKRNIREKWCMKGGSSLSEAERESFRRRMEDARRLRHEVEQIQRECTAGRAQKLWAGARPADPAHPYLVAKRVASHGLRQHYDKLIVPVTSEGKVVGLQFIAPDGKKMFLKGTPKRGRYHPIGQPDGRLIIAEGYATAASLHEATGIATVVAFDAYNLLPVANELRGRFPDAEVVVAGDNDRHTPGNPGATRAAAAAKAVGGRVAIPEFTQGEAGSDWNDIALTHGVHAVTGGVLPHFRPRAVRLGDISPAVTVEFAIHRLATAREPVLIVSDDGAGKTTVLLSILCAMAAEERVLDRFTVTGGPVLFISEEDSCEVLRNHAEAIARGHGWDIGRIHERVHVLALEGVQVEDDKWRRLILEEIRRLGVVAVGLDPYADLTRAKENDNDETRPFKSFLREICALGATPFVCHHAGKAGEGKRKRDRIRGASALAAAARSILFLEETPAGIAIEPLKLSRSVRHEPFVVSRKIDADAENPACWVRARLSYVAEHEAEERSADAFVLGLLDKHEAPTTTELKGYARGTGFSGEDISQALKRLQADGRITFEAGARGAKHWRLTLPEDSRQGAQMSLPNLPDPAGQGDDGSVHPAS